MAFRLSDRRCEEIKEIVVNTFEELKIRCIPISAFEMAAKLGAAVVPYSSKSEETRQLMMKRSEDGFTIKKMACGTFFITMQKATDVSITPSPTSVGI